MEINSTVKTVAQLKMDRGRYNLQPSYQRGAVWSRDAKQLLMDSMLKRYDIPKMYFAKPGERASEGKVIDVVDGQQRLRAIYAFLDGEIELGEQSQFGFGPHGDLSGVKFDDLPEDLRVGFQGYTVSIVTIEEATKEQIREMFLRLQEGKTLNPAEKRNAKICDIGDDVRELVNHKFMKDCVHANDSRYSHQDWIAHVACLIHHNGPVNVGARDLMKLYDNSVSGTVDAASVKREITAIMNQLYKAFGGVDTPELDVKWGFVDLLFMLFEMRKYYVITEDVLQAVAQFYKDFELERRGINDPQILLLPEYAGSFAGPRLFDYRECFVREGKRSQSIQTRAEVYLDFFLARQKSIKPKDPNRNFSRYERLVLWRLASEKCQVCGCDLSFSEMDADHITPHSEGGETTLENGRCLCQNCNRSGVNN